MRPNNMHAYIYRQQRGSTIMMAVFVIVVLSGLTAAMSTLLETSNESIAREVLSTRALLAAQSGAQREMAQMFPMTGGVVACAPLSLDAGVASGLPGCTAEVTCGTLVEAAGQKLFTITSKGTCGPADSAAVRNIQMQAKQ